MLGMVLWGRAADDVWPSWARQVRNMPSFNAIKASAMVSELSNDRAAVEEPEGSEPLSTQSQSCLYFICHDDDPNSNFW